MIIPINIDIYGNKKDIELIIKNRLEKLDKHIESDLLVDDIINFVKANSYITYGNKGLEKLNDYFNQDMQNMIIKHFTYCIEASNKEKIELFESNLDLQKIIIQNDDGPVNINLKTFNNGSKK